MAVVDDEGGCFELTGNGKGAGEGRTACRRPGVVSSWFFVLS